ncbi:MULTISPECIES: hypothetical protein [Erysipelotrichaceae]|uniref:hypothetical protein n=1 Tax=Erysipelotrichaceae TaxID=128827 RepID=UPI001314E494|nr:hypothetical protein [Absiella sp. AM27-20]
MQRDRVEAINFALQAIIEVLKTFELNLSAKNIDGIAFPIIVDCRSGKEYAIKKEGK